jgi:hypothetical protein
MAGGLLRTSTSTRPTLSRGNESARLYDKHCTDFESTF